MMNKIYPCIWFDSNAAEAAAFYVSVFRNSKVLDSNPFVVNWISNGQKFMCLNGGPKFKANPSISFYVTCETEDEVDEYWGKLASGGSVLMPLDKYDWSEKYGWLQDKFGVSWQISKGKMSDVEQKFVPSLLFTGDNTGKAEEALNMYTWVFNNSSVVGILKYPPGQQDEGLVMHAQFKLEGQTFMCMDSSLSHEFSFNEGISFVVECADQGEIDYFWDRLTRDGSESMCGWLKDKYGISWQIVPQILGQLMSDPERAGRVTNAFLKMRKFDIETLVNA